MKVTAAVIIAVILAAPAILGWPAALFPDVAAVVAVWAAMRSGRDAGMRVGLLVGMWVGLFTVEPWLLKPLVVTVAVLLVAPFQRAGSPAHRSGMAWIAALVLLGAAVFELTFRAALLPDSPDVRQMALVLARAMGTALLAPWMINALDRTRLAHRI